MINKTLYTILISFIFLGCAPKDLFFGDKKVYDSIKNYDYKYTEHDFNSEDGTQLKGMYIRTATESKGLIVMVNGMVQNMSTRFTKWLWIVDSGYDLFIFDYRGYGETTTKVDLYGFRDDVNAAVEYAHKLDKDGKIIVVGQSMGGTFVIDALSSKHYDYVSLAVIDSTFTGFASNLSSLMMKTVILLPVCWVPYTFSPTELNSIKNVQSVDVPILFVSGDSDRIISCDDSKELYEKADTKKAIWIVEDAGHVESFNDLKVREAFLELLDNTKLLTLKKERYFYNSI